MVVVGAKPFTEQYVLAEAIAQRLTQAGLRAENRSSMGSMILFDALAAGHVDCYVDYSGTIWANVMKRKDLPPRRDLLEQMKDWLQREHQVRVLGALGFENNYGLAVPRHKAEALKLASIQDLTSHASQMTIGADFEFFVRPEWAALREAYRLAGLGWVLAWTQWWPARPAFDLFYRGFARNRMRISNWLGRCDGHCRV